ncbi:MAG: ABC transporter ATP-binding protein [Thermodesulfobacteriota bacterium]
MKKPKIELHNVGVSRNGNIVLNDISLSFITGERNIIVGPSGAGKTTLLRLLNRMDDPSCGEITYDGKNIKEIPVLELRWKVGMVFQIPVTFEGTVLDNLLVPYRLGVKTQTNSKYEFEKALELSGLGVEFLERKASELSVGEKQRLNVARALVNKPDVLLLDEPTSALDSESAIKLLKSLRELNQVLGLTIIMVLHQLEQASFLGSSIIHIANGVVVREEELLKNRKAFTVLLPPSRGKVRMGVK